MLTTFTERGLIFMRNSFARNLNTLLAETISDSLVRLRKHNADYAKMLSKGLALNDELIKFLETDNFELTFKQKQTIKDFMEVESDTHTIEQTAVYFQGYADCIFLLKQFGFIT